MDDRKPNVALDADSVKSFNSRVKIPSWVPWRYDAENNIIYNVNDVSGLDEALQRYQEGGYDGIGVAGGGFVGIMLEECFRPGTGETHEALELAERLQGAYAEFDPDVNGVVFLLWHNDKWRFDDVGWHRRKGPWRFLDCVPITGMQLHPEPGTPVCFDRPFNDWLTHLLDEHLSKTDDEVMAETLRLGIEAETLKLGTVPAASVTDTYTAQGVRKEVNPPPVRELDLIDAATLSATEMPELVYYVANMLPQGCGLLVAPPKMGKSFLALQLSICVASGRPFLDHFTTQAGVVYVSLEDSRRRLKKRLAKQLGDSPKPDNLFLTTEAPTLDDGLIQSLESMLTVHPDIGLVIIDTLQYVRGVKKRDQNEYQYDAETIKPLKKLADSHGICVLIVHHTRKMSDTGNPFNQISGTNGLFGTVDFSWIITKEDFGELKGTIYTSGRDIEYQELAFEVDKSKMWYGYAGDAMQMRRDQELHDYKADPVFSGIRQLLLESENHRIKFKAQELLEAIEHSTGEKLDISARNLVAKLQRNGTLYHLSQDKIRYTTEEDGGKRGKWHVFESMPAHSNDGEEEAEEMKLPF